MPNCPNCQAPIALDTVFCGECGRPVSATARTPAAGPRAIVIGRDPASDFVVDHPKVSARHCQLRPLGHGVEVTDLGSSNGTFFGTSRQRVHAPVVLAYTDALFLGSEAVSLAQLAQLFGWGATSTPMRPVARTSLDEAPLAAAAERDHAAAEARAAEERGLAERNRVAPSQPPAATAPVAKAAVSGGGLMGALSFVVLCVVAWWAWNTFGTASRTPVGAVLGAIAEPEVVFDETATLDEGEAKLYSVTLARPRDLRVEVQASPKTVDIMLMTDEDVAGYRKAKGKLFGGNFTHRQVLSSPGVTAFDKTDSVPAGRWTLVVQRPQESALLTDKTAAKVKITLQ
jgi:hypothetical protein